ncbi:unnamed protein product [Phytomonas sp. Hart1]|nr:unnamed protein product [Phytomonas sp. Hart1]|eukprot:CCW70154.1 unnamed protein product [Phytomonas sp. isolate Hart1]
MLLYKALQRADCPICLQSIIKVKEHENEDQTLPLSSSSTVLDKTPLLNSCEGFRITFREEMLNLSVTPGNLNAVDQFSEPNLKRPSKMRRVENEVHSTKENNIVVLRCGHFMHILCVAQLLEFSSAKTVFACPICRTEINRNNLEADVIRFSPRTRPRKAPGDLWGSSPGSNEVANHVDDLVKDRVAVRVGGPVTDDVDDLLNDHAPPQHTGDEAVVVGLGQIPPPTAYADRLERSSKHFKVRLGNLAGRARHLQGSFQQLREDCAALEQTAATLRAQRQVLAGKEADEQRLAELRRMSAETKHSCDSLTSELAASTREEQALRHKIDKYKKKVMRLS